MKKLPPRVVQTKPSPGPALFLRLPPLKKKVDILVLKNKVRVISEHIFCHPNYRLHFGNRAPRVQPLNSANVSKPASIDAMASIQ